MKILIVSKTPLTLNNSFGISYSNILGGIPNLKIANIFLRDEEVTNVDPSLDIVFFKISEKSILDNFKDKKNPLGSRIEPSDIKKTNGQDFYTFGRKHRWQILYWGQELLWKFARSKTYHVSKDFVDTFSPDIIFQPIYYASYINKMANFIKKYTGCKMVGYISDDNYTLKKFHLSPLYWINRFIKRPLIRKTINNCEVLYTITQMQKNEYSKLFKPECKILTKCYDFVKRPPFNLHKDTIICIYAGGVGNGRWKTLLKLAKEINQANSICINKMKLSIYTPTPLKKRIIRQFEKQDANLFDPIPYSELVKIQKESDLMIFVESFNLRDKLDSNMSFSTKLVDFFYLGKPILAIGPKEIASIKYLQENNAALVSTNKKEIKEKISLIINNSTVLENYSKNSWDCGKAKHNRKEMCEKLIDDFVQNI